MSEAITRLERFAVVETVFDREHSLVLEVAALVYDRQGKRLASWETLVRPDVYLRTETLKRSLDITYEEMQNAPFSYDAGPLFRCLLTEWKVQLATAWNVRETFGDRQLWASEWRYHPTFVNNGIAGYLNSPWLHTSITDRVSDMATAMERATFSADALMSGNKSFFKQWRTHADEFLNRRATRVLKPTFTRQDLAALRAGGAV